MRVVEVFKSIDGEALRAGQLTNFIRLSECNLRCAYCDTAYAQLPEQGNEMAVDQIILNLNSRIKNVTLTGGEPLLHHREASALLQALINKGYKVSVETNGSVNLADYIANFPEVSFIMDYKGASSKMEDKMDLNNFDYLRPEKDCVKFVVGNTDDLATMEAIGWEYGLFRRQIPVFVSPVFGDIELVEIVDYMSLANLTGVRLQVQLHKIVWEPSKRGV